MMFGTGNGYRKYEDLAALGIIADCMDSRTLDNNAIILNGLTHIYNPMFMALLEKQGGGGFRIKDITNPTKLDVAFYIAPLINAVIRSGTIDDKRQLFEGFIGVGANQTFDSTWRGKERHESFYEFVARNAINLRGRQNRIKDKSMEAIEEIVQKENLLQNKVLIIKVSAELVSKNITGLVAMDAVNTYGKPTLVVRPVVETINGKQVVFYRGSGRAPVVPGFNNFMAVLQESGLMDYVEGHENAFGVSIAEDHIDDLTAFLNKRLATIDFDNKVEMVDCCVNDDNWNVLVLKEFGSLEHIYGNGIPEPKFHFEFSARDIDFRIQGQHEDSLKISHDGITLIAFHCVPLIESYKKICTEYPNNELKVEVIGTASINTWNGYDNVQIIIKEAELSVSDIVVQKPANMSMLF
jgi:single-stranded-DNA-specific exonuclease